ncbi:hypothetical protein CYY_009763 [Polysphondylium violaceum]|uniref:Uncharacterized protein n=1 Tax=Polysphondylium violaceum TaxID=133409 RepID=A0A8J4PKZ0_9MYCE|nr:hypothetical protein CYY_009763 [Polysphondylium violaceum]
MTESFYLIWRNQYIRRLIRNLVCQNVLIRVDKEYLKDNQQYLSMFTNKDTLDYNIRIRFNGGSKDYLDINNSNRNLINDVELKIKADFNLSKISDGVHKLALVVTATTATVMGQLPNSITDLKLASSVSNELSPPIIQQILSNLPSHLQQLYLGKSGKNCIQSTCVLPQSLTDLYYGYKYSSLKWLVVPPNKVYKNCMLDLESNESFQWLVENRFICTVNIDLSAVPLLKSRQLPSHVTEVHFKQDIAEPDLLLPQTVERLFFPNFVTPVSHITHLKFLCIYDECSIKLEKGVLPRSLESLSLSYDEPLEPDVLPQTITILHLYSFNQPLCINVLPLSLTDLTLGSFNQPLNAFVLPPKLKVLNMFNFKQPTFFADSLPMPLTDLTLYKFNGSFDQCQPLDNLKKLRIDSLVPSLAGLLTNIKKLDLWVSKTNDPSGTCLANTSIESLYLYAVETFSPDVEKSTLYPNSLPPTIKYLSLINVDIKSDKVIPSSCRYLKSRNSKNVPKSVRYIKSIK